MLTHGGSEFSRNNGELFSRRNERNAPREINTRAHRIRARNKSVPSKNFIHCDFFSFSFFFFTAKRSSGFSDPMIHDNSNSSRPGLIHRIDLFRESRRTHPTDSSFLLLVPCIILLTFYLPLERSRSGRILDKVFQRKGGIVIA